MRGLDTDGVLAAPALAQAAMIRVGALSSVDLVRAYLDRIERVNPRLHAFTEVLRREALREAAARDRVTWQRRREGLPAFHGVPIAVKDLQLARGAFTRMGSRAYQWLYSPHDDVTVRTLRRGGFVILGKLATSEFGASPSTEPDTHPPTSNPWDPAVSPGGSSGGSAAAVAAGLLPIAQGSDGGGSLRIPAAFCHLYALKPTYGLLPNPFTHTDTLAISAVGPLSRTVEDAAVLVALLAGRTLVETWPRKPLRVRFTARSPLGDATAEIAAATRHVAELLARDGHDVREGPGLSGDLDEFTPIWQRTMANVPFAPDASVEPVVRWMRTQGRRLLHPEVRALRDRLAARVLDWFGDADLWLTPTVPVPPPPLGAFRGLEPEESFRKMAPLGAFTAPFNLTGQPAASLPAGLSSAGHPIGVQLAARRGDDALLLAVSRRLEAQLRWRERRTDRG